MFKVVNMSCVGLLSMPQPLNKSAVLTHLNLGKATCFSWCFLGLTEAYANGFSSAQYSFGLISYYNLDYLCVYHLVLSARGHQMDPFEVFL